MNYIIRVIAQQWVMMSDLGLQPQGSADLVRLAAGKSKIK
jgi:hypothetical protein